MSLAWRSDGDPARARAEELLQYGYCIVPDMLPVETVEELHRDLKPRFANTPFCEGDFFGSRTRRFGGLLKRSPHAATLVEHPLVMDILARILGPNCDHVQLNLTQAIEIWPGEPEQAPHRDEDMWPVPKGEIEYLVNVMWPLTSFRAENGATVVWPGSNGKRQSAPPQRSDAIAAEMNPGSALLFLGSTLHCGGANRSAAPRAGIVCGYTLGWLRPYENQWLVYPPDVARTFSPELAALVGYRRERPNIGNYEGQCPSILLNDTVPEYIRFQDAFKDDQVRALAAYRARQLAAQRG
jgi:ectoine hydroxylase-related dioxygenase (phytanoyl-CoA dioxygenase family)